MAAQGIHKEGNEAALVCAAGHDAQGIFSIRSVFALKPILLLSFQYYHAIPKGNETASGYINITSSTKLEERDACTIAVINPSGEYRLRGKTAEETAAWMIKLHAALAFAAHGAASKV